MTPLVYEAMQFARQVHKDQKRKYTNEPYSSHLAEVAGIVAAVTDNPEALATAWLHDTVEDQHVDLRVIAQRFGEKVAEGVEALSDIENGNRKDREAASRQRLHAAAPWIQTIKVADIISNSSTIALHDPGYAPKYLDEKRAMLAVLDHADSRLMDIAVTQTQRD
ncbi:HD domain-containing protein [Taklimakanibacter deserti]|uniref:HD domain-containing protein n=1 Tax=Taklimakanibacter deserti TaxID=2267839 RepID=UPI000E647A7E